MGRRMKFTGATRPNPDGITISLVIEPASIPGLHSGVGHVKEESDGMTRTGYRVRILTGLLLAFFWLTSASARAAPGLSIGNASIVVGPSGTRNVAFVASLSAPASSPVSVAYTTNNGTATAGTDYTMTSGTLTLPAGETAGGIYVPVIGTTADASGLTFTVTLSSPVNATITNGTGTCTITHDAVPVAVGVSPNPATAPVGTAQVLTSTVTSVGGPSNLAKVGLSVGQLSSPAASLYAEYVVGTNSLYLANSSGTYIGGFTPGSNNVISTGLGTLNCQSTTVTTSGNQLVIAWSLTPAQPLAGTQSVYLSGSDVFGLGSGWEKLATWAVGQAVPVALNLSPVTSNFGQAQTLSTYFTYAGGLSNLSSVALNIGNLSAPSTSLYAKYAPATGLLYLANSSGTYIGGFAPGSSNVITTGLATLNCAATTVTPNGQQLQINWNFTPTSSLAGKQNVYATLADSFGTSSGWQNIGSWTIGQAVPVAVSVSPNPLVSQVNVPQTLTTNFREPLNNTLM